MSTLMVDILSGEVTPGQGNAVCNAGGKLLKNIELEQKYGRAEGTGMRKVLELSAIDVNDPPQLDE